MKCLESRLIQTGGKAASTGGSLISASVVLHGREGRERVREREGRRRRKRTHQCFICLYCRKQKFAAVQTRSCKQQLEPGTVSFLCELPSRSTNRRPHLPDSTIRLLTSTAGQRHRFVQCESETLTLSHLACDSLTGCFRSGHVAAPCAFPMTPLPPSFECSGSVQRLSYTLVCDFRSDCTDNSDEDFCVFPLCPPGQFPCGNKQVGRQ